MNNIAKTKKTQEHYDKKIQEKNQQMMQQMGGQPGSPHIPKEAQEKMDEIKKRIDKFQKELLKKFEEYIMGLTLLPPQKNEKGEFDKDKINVLVLVDDTDSKKMSKLNLKDKLSVLIGTIATDADKDLVCQTVLLSEVWQNCYDAKYDYLQLIASGAQIFDKGMLAAIKISEIHKTMVLKKFEKYIVSYVLAGSLVQGRATPESDIDVFMVIDDTDVKKMTRAELKDKLRAIIIGMGLEAAEMTGIRNKLNIQVYILTDFWENIKEANPIIFTFLRDGIPFYDRGIFMPWKQLLKMGKIKPSPESIDMMMSSGEQMINRIEMRIKEIGMEDMFYSLLMPSQAAIMLYGIPPPTPKETPKLMREIFVKKEKMLEEKYVKILEDVILVRKELEHGSRTKLSGTELDKLLTGSHDYLKRITELFSQIDQKKEAETVIDTYEGIISMVRDVLVLEGKDKITEKEIFHEFENTIINKGLIPAKFKRSFENLIQAKKDYDAKKLTRTEVNTVQKESRAFIKTLVEYIQRKRGKEIEKTKIRVKHGDKYGEVILLEKDVFIIHDIDNPEPELSKGKISEKGAITGINKSSMLEFEKALAKISISPKVFIKQPIFDDIKEIFGEDVEIMLNY